MIKIGNLYDYYHLKKKYIETIRCLFTKETRILTPIQNTLIYSHLQDSRLYFPAKSSKRS